MWFLSITLLVFANVISGGSTTCITTADTPAKKATPNTPCRFPFVFKNKTLTGCLPDNTAPRKYWCSTKVEDVTNRHVANNWGFCSSGCRINGDISCSEDQTCRFQEDCFTINYEYKKWKTLRKGPEKRNLGTKLKSLICNKNKKIPIRFCCPLVQASVRGADRDVQDDQQDVSGEQLATPQPQAPLVIVDEESNKSSHPPSCQEEPTTNFLGNILPRSGQCGLSCNTDARVVNGENSKLGEFPWAALLGYQYRRRKFIFSESKYVPEPFVKYKCGGTLINTWYVLTAAHCHGEDRKTNRIYQVVLGEWEVSDKAFHNKDPDCVSARIGCLPPVQRILVDKVAVHDDYSKTRKGIYKDIALIRLKTEAVLNAAVQMACLPHDTSIMAAELQINGFGSGLGGYKGTVIGWGHTENFDEGDLARSAVPKAILQKAKLPLWSIEECQEIIGEGVITPEHLCAGGGHDGADSCKGDSGGGIFIRKNTTDQVAEKLYGYVQVGLVSYGSPECGDGSPGVYTRVTGYISWIQQNMEP